MQLSGFFWRACKKAVAVVALFSLGAGNVLAVPLQDLFDGASITVNDKVFADWELIDDFSSSVFDFSSIDVSGDGSSLFDPGPTLIFTSSALSATDDAFIDFEFEFTVSTTSGEPLIKDNSLGLDSLALLNDGGFINIAETLFDVNDIDLSDLLVEADSSVLVLSDGADFSPQSSVLVNSTVLVDGGGQGSSAELTGWRMGFSQVEATVPAPGTFALLGAALLAAGARRSRD